MLIRYLRQLDRARIVLWCYAVWYLVVFVRYFDPSPALWLTSCGLSAIIGVALLLSTRAAMGSGRLGRWGVFRLFLMPFCVSSFSALVKGRGFFLICLFDGDILLGGIFWNDLFRSQFNHGKWHG